MKAAQCSVAPISTYPSIREVPQNALRLNSIFFMALIGFVVSFLFTLYAPRAFGADFSKLEKTSTYTAAAKKTDLALTSLRPVFVDCSEIYEVLSSRAMKELESDPFGEEIRSELNTLLIDSKLSANQIHSSQD